MNNSETWHEGDFHENTGSPCLQEEAGASLTLVRINSVGPHSHGEGRPSPRETAPAQFRKRFSVSPPQPTKVHGWPGRTQSGVLSLPAPFSGCLCVRCIALPLVEPWMETYSPVVHNLSRFTSHSENNAFILGPKHGFILFLPLSHPILSHSISFSFSFSCQLGDCRLGEQSRNKLIFKFTCP